MDLATAFVGATKCVKTHIDIDVLRTMNSFCFPRDPAQVRMS